MIFFSNVSLHISVFQPLKKMFTCLLNEYYVKMNILQHTIEQTKFFNQLFICIQTHINPFFFNSVQSVIVFLNFIFLHLFLTNNDIVTCRS